MFKTLHYIIVYIIIGVCSFYMAKYDLNAFVTMMIFGISWVSLFAIDDIIELRRLK